MGLSPLLVVLLGTPVWSSTDTLKGSEQTLVMPADGDAQPSKRGQETLITPLEADPPLPGSKGSDSETLVMPADPDSTAAEPRKGDATPLDPGEQALALVESMRETLDRLAAALKEGSRLKPDAGPALREADRELKALVDPQGISASISGIAQSLSALSSGIAEADGAEQRQAAATLRRLDKRLQSLVRAEAPAGEKPAPREEEASGGLAALRAAVFMYYRDSEGVYPPDLKTLAENGRYMAAIPSLEVGGHGRTASVRVLARVRDQEDLGSQVADTGGWLYVADPSSPNAGTVLIDCTHLGPEGVQWYKY